MRVNSKHTIARAAGIVGILTLLSRLVGLFRDRLFASHFGAGNLLDSYYAAFRIPDLIFNLLILGTLSVAFIPVFTEYFIKDEEQATKIANTILNISFVGMSVVCLVLYFLVPQLTAHIIAPGFTGQKLAETISLTKIFLLSPIIFTISSVFSSVLNSLKRFLLVSLAPIIYNFGIIFGILFLYPRYGINGLAYGVIIGALCHLLVQMIGAFGSGFKYKLIFDYKSAGVKKIGKLFLPRIFGVDSSQVSLLIASIIGSFFTAGTIAVFNFANNLQAVPIGIFAISFAVAVFPNLSESFAKKDEAEFNATLIKTTTNILFFVIPISVLFILLRAQIVRVVYGAGQFNWESTKLTANTLGIFSISIFAQSLSPLFSRTFYARHNTIIPVIIGLLTLTLNAFSSFYFGRTYGVFGLAVGFTVSNILNAAILYILLRMRLYQFNDLPIFVTTFKIVLASLVLGLVTYGCLHLFSAILPLDRTIKVLLQGSFAGGMGILAFFFTASLLKLEQTRYALRIVKGKFL